VSSQDRVVQVLDDRFLACVDPSATLTQVADGCVWNEGPVYLPDRRLLAWSDIPNDRMLCWDETTGQIDVFRQPAGYTNGNTLDREGRLVTCEHGARRVTRTEPDGTITVLADRYLGKRLNSPNDVVVRSDGTVWFTDPTYGIDSDREGHRADPEQDGCYVFRVDPVTGEVALADDSFVRPNGLAFSLDEQQLYVSDTGATHVEDGPRHIRVFDVAADGSLSGGEVFARSTAGLFDGFRLDEHGRLWTSAADGVHCYDPDGTLLGKLLVPEVVANVVFGGPDRTRLFICATTTVRAIDLFVRGAPPPIRRSS
jgi:gluconolactonase